MTSLALRRSLFAKRSATGRALLPGDAPPAGGRGAVPGSALLGDRPRALQALLTFALCAVAAIFGAALAVMPMLVVGAVALALVFVFAFKAPVAHLLTLVALTALVPLELQNRASSLVLPSDMLLLAGLARAVFVLAQLRLERRVLLVAGIAIAFLGVIAVQMAQATAIGRSLSGTGAEARTLLGFATILVALPILHDPAARRRLVAGLAAIGLALGAWGVAQFVFQIRFGMPTDLGAGPIGYNTAGRVVGMYAFPAAAVLAMAALAAGAESMRATVVLSAVLGLNCLAVVLTFERTFMIATLLGFAALLVFGTPGVRRRVLVGAPLGVLATLVALAVLAPGVLSAVGSRLATIGNIDADPSAYYRVVEGRLVLDRIEQRPLAGSGFGASIQIGRPGTTQPIRPRRYAENGYLWLFWKVGIAGGAVLLALLAACIAAGRARRHDPATGALVAGAQASLVALAAATYFFPSFNQLAITPILGVLAAICVTPPLVREVAA